MSALDQVRKLFPTGAVVECVENTYIPQRAGSVVTITRGGKTVCDARMGGKPFRMSLPTRVRDVVHVTENTATWLLGDQPVRLRGHSVTYRSVAT